MNERIKPLFSLEFIVVTIAFVGYHLPFFINGSLSLIQIGDTMDGMLPTINSLVHSSDFLSFDKNALVEGYNQQVYRTVLFAPWNINSVMFRLMPNSWTGYFMNMVAINLISFGGMYLFTKHVIRLRSLWLNVIIALTYMALPKYFLFGGAVYSGLPLVLFQFFSIAKDPTRWKYIGLFLLPCTIGFVIGGFPIVMILGLLVLISVFQKTQYANKIRAFIVYLAGVLFADINLILFKINAPFEPHRVLRLQNSLDSSSFHFGNFLGSAKGFLFNENFNEQTSGHLIILGVLALALALMIFVKVKGGALSERIRMDRERNTLFIVFGGLVVLIILLYTVLKTKSGITLPAVFYQFDLSRVSSVLPALYFMLLGFSIYKISSLGKAGYYLALVLVTLNLAHVLRGNDLLKENIKVAVTQNYSDYHHTNMAPYRHYFATILLDMVGRKFPDIQEKQFKTMSYGLHPAVPAMAGYNTVDFYQNIYPVEYNYRFREYLGDQTNTRYYMKLTRWGNRVYFIDDYLMKNWEYKDKVLEYRKREDQPAFNWTKIKEDGIHFLFSAVEFENCPDLELMGKFSDPKSCNGTILLYKVD